MPIRIVDRVIGSPQSGIGVSVNKDLFIGPLKLAKYKVETNK